MQYDKKENATFCRRFSEVSFPPIIPKSHEILVVVGSAESLANIVVSLEERKKAAVMTHAETRDRFLAGRRIVRGVFSKWIGLAPDALPIIIGPDGKPSLQNRGDLHFSIAHSGDLIVVAFAGSAVGVDVELEREIDARGLAKRFFSPRESASVEGDQRLFFPLWTRREAAVKADGRGLAGTLSRTSASTTSAGDWQPVTIGESLWQTLAWKEGHHHVALAAARVPGAILWCDLRTLVL
jgi:4'-phosphopantetheinyl transferase